MYQFFVKPTFQKLKIFTKPEANLTFDKLQPANVNTFHVMMRPNHLLISQNG